MSSAQFFLSSSRHWLFALLVIGLQISASTAALAICTVNSVASLTPTSASTGTYTYPTETASQSVTLSIVVNYTAALGDACRIALSFQRATLPATMLLSAGSATLPYTVTSSAGGGNTLLYTSGIPASGNRIEAAFNAPILAVGASATMSVTVHFLMQPGTPPQAGSYSDATLSASVFRVAPLTGILTLLSSVSFGVSGSVAKVCTIGGLAAGPADAATIPITALGAVNTAPIVRSYANAACNTPSNLQLTSQSGAVLRSGAPPSGFTNLINYTASAGFSGATATLNTATVAGATGPESGTAVSTSGATPSGSLSLTITPATSSLPLISGSYGDTLRISITPQ
jgi:hypothetical protein